MSAKMLSMHFDRRIFSALKTILAQECCYHQIEIWENKIPFTA